ncbi:MAG: ABC-type lipopolysaccharide export system permease component LptG [Phormidesmis priestleyi Ana]|uniref:ABC-type lipopolysaccharide export system permease component LptG n=1 Tax=Phormidesmis priestleyi Ana TaxID=1666911 RepID=A0A0P7YWI6_9CYAN|nr:MAG: ABC-type lipopolysaccharide export system permease component LptG [Phormidesmis priestleyi Ana]
MTTSTAFNFTQKIGRWLPHPSIMDRYIARELTFPFLFGVGAFSSIGVSIGALFELIRKATEYGLPAALVFEVFLLSLPEFVVLAFPMSTLLASMMTFSRLSSDSELIALRGCGVSVKRIVVPAVLLSLLITGISFSVQEVVAPASTQRAKLLLARALDEEKPPFREGNITFQQEQPAEDGSGDELVRFFHARTFDGTTMGGITVVDFSQEEAEDGLKQIINADTATWDFSRNLWVFTDGTIYAVSPDGSFRQIIRFDQQDLQLPRTPLDLAQRPKRQEEMNIAESKDYLEILRQTGDERAVRKLRVAIQNKYSVPFACVVFGLVGSAVGIRPQRTGKATSFGISIVIIFGYYVLSFVLSAMAESGIISPFVSGWLPLGLGLGAGVFLLAKTSR